jgi:hypothetical protein
VARPSTVFDAYWFADYSGAASPSAQKKAIRVVEAVGARPPHEVVGPFTRASLRAQTLERLAKADRRGERVVLGFDHQVGLPWGLARELGLEGLDGLAALRAFVAGDYAADAPRVGPPETFARAFNDWCGARKRPPYFYSAIRGRAWGLPTRDPRRDEPRAASTRFRLCEKSASPTGRGTPKPMNRVGDNGSVGGQSLLGWVELVRLLDDATAAGVKLRVWPLAGLDLEGPAYASAHVLVEPYPAAVRDLDVPYDDLNDAQAAALFVQRTDRGGRLLETLDLGLLAPKEADAVRFEGWIAGFKPPDYTRAHPG